MEGQGIQVYHIHNWHVQPRYTYMHILLCNREMKYKSVYEKSTCYDIKTAQHLKDSKNKYFAVFIKIRTCKH